MSILKLIPIVCILTLPFFLAGCSPPALEAVSTGVTEGVIQGIEDINYLNKYALKTLRQDNGVSR